MDSTKKRLNGTTMKCKSRLSQGSTRCAYNIKVKNKNTKFNKVPHANMSRQNSWVIGRLLRQRSMMQPMFMGPNYREPKSFATCSSILAHSSSVNKRERV
jgi:hypothetical protein